MNTAAVIELASAAGPVIPLKGKVPLLADWPNRATRDAAAIKALWDVHRDANIGLVTGKIAGYFVLDVDGAEGYATLAGLTDKHGAMPDTWTSHTGGGGVHLFFRWPGWPVRTGAHRLGRKLDVRGEGGQVVAPPSVHPNGKTYRWAVGLAPGERALAPAPDWLLELLRPRPEPVRAPAPTADEHLLKRASGYLATIPGAVTGAGGHDQTWNAALKVVRGFALDDQDAFSLLANEYNPRCDPPWSEKELRHKVADAARSGLPLGFLRDVQKPPPMRDIPAHRRVLNLQPVSALLAESIADTKWLYGPYIPELSFGELVGPPGLGKTLLMIYIMTQMAQAGFRCALIEMEGGRKGLQMRIKRAVEAAVGTSPVDITNMIHFTHAPAISLMDSSDVLSISEELKGFDFALFDSFARASAGLDEDKSKDMGPVIERIEFIKRESRCAPWLNHHTGKSKWKPGDVPRLGDGRGSSALPGALDTELAIVPVHEGDKEEDFIKFVLHVTKQRDEDDAVTPRLVSIARRGPAAILRMDAEKATAVPPNPQTLMQVQKFIRSCGPNGASKNQIEKTDKVKGSSEGRRIALMYLKQQGEALEQPFGKFTRWVFSGFAEPRLDEPQTSPDSPDSLREGEGGEPESGSS